jgi:alginate O-acetyltransferase complex protein AlgI
VAWGAYHGLFLVIERITGLRRMAEDRLRGLRRLATLLVVLCGWVLFRCEDLGQAGAYFAAMFSFRLHGIAPSVATLFDLKNAVLMLCSATCLILPPGPIDAEPQLERRRLLSAVMGIFLFLVLLPWCLTIMASESLNPFIYYRF